MSSFLSPVEASGTSRTAFWTLLEVRLLELSREPTVLFWNFVFPVLLAIALGLVRVQSSDVMEVDVIVPLEQQFIGALRAVSDLRVVQCSAATAEARYREGRSILVIAGDDGQLEFRFDPSRKESVMARMLADQALQQAAGTLYKIQVKDRARTESGYRYIDFLIPGILALTLMNGGLWGVGFVLVNMRVRKVLKTLAGTPMRHADFLLSMLASRLILVMLEAASLLVLTRWIFGVRVLGSFLLVGMIVGAGAMAFSAIGMLLAMRAETADTVNGLINLIMLPMFVLSGIFFSTDRFPALVQPFIHFLPLTALVDALRATVTRGAVLADVLGSLSIVAIWGLIAFSISLRYFRWV